MWTLNVFRVINFDSHCSHSKFFNVPHFVRMCELSGGGHKKKMNWLNKIYVVQYKNGGLTWAELVCGIGHHIRCKKPTFDRSHRDWCANASNSSVPNRIGPNRFGTWSWRERFLDAMHDLIRWQMADYNRDKWIHRAECVSVRVYLSRLQIWTIDRTRHKRIDYDYYRFRWWLRLPEHRIYPSRAEQLLPRCWILCLYVDG